MGDDCTVCVEIKGALKFLGNAAEQVGQTAASEEGFFLQFINLYNIILSAYIKLFNISAYCSRASNAFKYF